MYRAFGKRIFDLIIFLVGLPIFILVFLIFTPLIWYEDYSTPFYNALRVGKDGKLFKMYKFRSMKMNAIDIRNADGSTFNAINDQRLTKIGAFIRKMSIDEVPQVINVLKGEMSFIGPRPDLPDALVKFTEHQKEKFKVLPGISGYTQAYFRNSIELKQRIENDIYYVNNISFLFDLKILWETILTILLRKNIYAN